MVSEWATGVGWTHHNILKLSAVHPFTRASDTVLQDFCAGTAEFMSPEVLLSEEYGLPSDVFSLGMIFVEMLTGQEPSHSFPERPPQVRSLNFGLR